ncbi:MAG: threonine synthase [Tunicatimonas sp.]
MQLYSTYDTHQTQPFTFQEAVFKSLPDDNGLFMPESLPRLPAAFFATIEARTFSDIAFKVAEALLSDEIPPEELRRLIDDAIDFDAPLVLLDDQVQVLELFHGPTLAFKDFGARFMARVMSWFLQKSPQQQDVNILVATSGDTGGAVAQGFLGVPGIRVTLLYPKGQVSILQEKQLTTVGHNVTALEVDGTFDDCQRLVKQAFLDTDINRRLNLASANSINISRLVPQSFYYFWAYAQLKQQARFDPNRELVFSVPSGNFGNLCGGLIAQRMGLPVHRFVAATNANDIVPQYLTSGEFTPRPSVRTLSNAMDVGNPSNFARLLAFYQADDADATVRWGAIKKNIIGKFYTDAQTQQAIRAVYEQHDGYVMCPHTAVGYLGLRDHLRETDSDAYGVVLATAHPAKFLDTVEAAIKREYPLPPALQALVSQKKHAIPLDNHYETLRAFLLENQ